MVFANQCRILYQCCLSHALFTSLCSLLVGTGYQLSCQNFQQQCFDLFCTAQLRAVWQPMTFVFIYNALQLTNAAWMNFLVEGLGFMAWQIGIVGIAGSIFSWMGIMTYEKFFFAANWRIVYFWCTTLATIIALGQLVLVFGWNRSIGIPDIWFSMGDDVLVEFVIAVQFLAGTY